MSSGPVAKQSANCKRLFSVPNTEEGRLFLKLASKFGNHERYRFNRIGRGRAEGPFGGCKQADADWIAINAYDKRG